ncbi:MAG: hypothetical protein N2316_01600 [Spirochaetes bacterium]|nr:hypothetical protein [Spirochaetota bacterium]
MKKQLRNANIFAASIILKNIPPLILNIFFISSLSIFCCTSYEQTANYRHISYFEGNSSRSEKSDQKIANSPTWQIFFSMLKPEKCIKIVFTSKTEIETLKGTIVNEIISYFIVEKLIDISRYNFDKKNIFYEIGKNFDLRWNTSQIAIICTDDNDPLKKLEPGLYRIRFTGFKSSDFNYRIEIFSHHEQVKFGL